MQLSVRDLVTMFNVSESTVRRWVKYQELPAQRVAGQFRFNRVEVLDWAIAHQIKLENGAVDKQIDLERFVRLADALEAGGIYYQIPSDSQAAALRGVISYLPLPNGMDRELLLRLFLAREASASTAIGEGIAIPHVRNPIVLHVSHPLVTLAFLSKPIDFGALDGKPVHVLFSIISPTNRSHLQLLARLSFALHDQKLRQAVISHAPSEEILQEIRRVEARMDGAVQVGKAAR